jgi:large subunit ribosomal protein L24
MNIKKGDTVIVIAGKDKGAQGKVIDGLPRATQRCSSRVSTAIKKHTKVTTAAARRPAASSPRRPRPRQQRDVLVEGRRQGSAPASATARRGRARRDGQDVRSPRRKRANGEDI